MDNLILDIFHQEEFQATQMTELVEDIDYVPYEIDAMGVFETEYLRTTTVTFYQRQGQLVRVPTTERGTPEPTRPRNGAILKQIEGHRLAERDTVRASEVQNLLAPQLPQATRLANAQELVAERQATLVDDINYTKEFHRLGALQGVVYDADGTTILDDWFDLWGITRPTDITFDFAAFKALEDQGDLRGLIEGQVVTPMMRALKRRRRPGTEVHSLCGDDFWTALSSSPAYERTMLTDAMRQALNNDRSWETITMGGVTFHHYFGSDDKALEIADNEAIFFPMGAKDVFKEYYLPGEGMNDINQKGLELYSVTSPDYRPNLMEWVDIYVKSYPVYACLCPQALFRGFVA